MKPSFNVNVAKSRVGVGFEPRSLSASQAWQSNDFFNKVNYQKNLEKKFTLLDGPPYANGPAHLGHALNKVFKDLVLKSQWYFGNAVVYQPGWDCHGLPLELAVEKKLGKTSVDALKAGCKTLAYKSVVKQRKDFKALGVLADWKKPYLTLSPELKKSSWLSLAELVKKDLLEVKRYPVHYCPVCGSSLAEAELEYKKSAKDSLFFKVKLNDWVPDTKPVYALVWTTTPWTLPMNQGVALNSKFRYALFETSNDRVVVGADAAAQQLLLSKGYTLVCELSGQKVLEAFKSTASPLTGKDGVLMHADFVQESGTGFVHLAPCHGPEDFEVWADKSSVLSYLNKHGVYTNMPKCLSFLEGVKQSQAQSLVLQALTDNNLLVEHSTTEEEQAVCWRHGQKVFYNATYQAFLNLDKVYPLVQKLMDSSDVDVSHKERLLNLAKTRKHWCLSRQRHWGTAMNLVLDKKDNCLDKQATLAALTACVEDTEVVVPDNKYLFTDVLDVWFDSGNMVNANLFKDSSFEVDLVLEGKDQYRGWFQSLLWLTVAVHEKLPFKDVFCHGFVLDSMKEKFSKSKGNARPLEHYLNKYGPDVLRLWVASQDQNTDCVFSDAKLAEVQRYYSRMRLGLRFLTSNLYDYDFSQHESDLQLAKKSEFMDYGRFVLNEFSAVDFNVGESFKKYKFKDAVESVYHFFDKSLSANFFDWAKPWLYLQRSDSLCRKQVQAVLAELLFRVLEWTKVLCPFTSEEFYQDLTKNGSVYLRPKLVLEKFEVSCDWQSMLTLKKSVNLALDDQQTKKLLGAKLQAKVLLQVDVAQQRLLNQAKVVGFKEFFGVSEVAVDYAENVKDLVLVTNLSQKSDYCKCARCWEYSLKALQLQDLCKNCQEQEHC